MKKHLSWIHTDVLLAIENGEPRPETIAEATGLSVGTVQTALGSLIRMGLVTEAGGGGEYAATEATDEVEVKRYGKDE